MSGTLHDLDAVDVDAVDLAQAEGDAQVSRAGAGAEQDGVDLARRTLDGGDVRVAVELDGQLRSSS
jgi:hypothetical protein